MFPHDFLYLVIVFLLAIKRPLFPKVVSVLNVSVYQVEGKKVNNSQLSKKKFCLVHIYEVPVNERPNIVNSSFRNSDSS